MFVRVLLSVCQLNFSTCGKSELTTRCPIEIVMRKSNTSFRARVSLHEPGANPSTAPFNIVSQDKLEQAIDEAQRAMVAGLGDVRVSKSSIVVEVTGADQPDLTIIDLPGTVTDVG